MDDLISRQAAIKLLYKRLIESANNNVGYVTDAGIVFEDIATERIKIWLNELPTIEERKAGKWTEKEVICAEEAKTAIEEWQSCRCSVCGRYDTRPYMYYFSNPNYCSWCGAVMKGEENE